MPRGAQPVATKARNSSVVGRLRLGEVCCSSLITRPWCHDGQSLPNPVSTVRGTPVGTGRPEQVAYGLRVASTDRTARPTTAYRSLPSLRAGTRRAMRPSGPPTDEIPIWTTPDGVDSVTAQAVIDLAMRAGVAMIATGAAAADVTATVLTLTKAYGLSSVHVDVTYTSVTVSYHRGPTADPITVMRIVRFRVQDYTRLERLRGLIVDLSQDPVSVDEARVRFDSVITAPHPYRRWLVTVAGGALAAAAAGLVGAGPFIILISFLTATLVGRVLAWLTGAGVAAFFAQCVGAAIPTAVATLVVVAQSAGLTFVGDVSPSLVVASGIVLLLAGLSVVGAAEDALEGYYVTAGARGFEVIVLSLGIAVGISIVLSLGKRLDYPIAITSQTLLSDNVVVQVVCAVIISVAFAVLSYSSGTAVVVAGCRGRSRLGRARPGRAEPPARSRDRVGHGGPRHRLRGAPRRAPPDHLGARGDDGRDRAAPAGTHGLRGHLADRHEPRRQRVRGRASRPWCRPSAWASGWPPVSRSAPTSPGCSSPGARACGPVPQLGRPCPPTPTRWRPAAPRPCSPRRATCLSSPTTPSPRRNREQAHGIRPWAYAACSGRLVAARPSGAG